MLISDVGMADMNGYTLIQRIRQREGLSRQSGTSTAEAAAGVQGILPALALTAYAAEGDQAQAIAAGFQRHLPKPVDPEILVQTILDLTAKQRSR